MACLAWPQDSDDDDDDDDDLPWTVYRLPEHTRLRPCLAEFHYPSWRSIQEAELKRRRDEDAAAAAVRCTSRHWMRIIEHISAGALGRPLSRLLLNRSLMTHQRNSWQ